MTGRLRRMAMSGVVVAAALGAVPSPPLSGAASAADCIFPLPYHCGAFGNRAGTVVHGFLYIRGLPEATAGFVGTGNGCTGCVWRLVRGHDPACLNGETDILVFLAVKGGALQFTGSYCLPWRMQLVTARHLAVDAARYLRDVPVPPLVVLVQPPGGTLVNLPTYFRATATVPAPATFGPADVRLTISVTPLDFAWSWGDGTPDLLHGSAGGPYPTGDVRHSYRRAGVVTAGVRGAWRVSYVVDTPAGRFGPVVLAEPLRPPAVPIPLRVVEARAELVAQAL